MEPLTVTEETTPTKENVGEVLGEEPLLDEKSGKVPEERVEPVTNGEAMIGDTQYATLKEALLIGGEVKLLKDVSVDEIIEITNDTVLDLGDFTITDHAPRRPFEVRTGNFTIKANKGGMVIPESNTQAYGFVDAYVNNFSILGGRYTGNTDNGRLFRINITESKKGTINVKGIVANTNNEIIGHKGTFESFSGSITDSEFYTNTRPLYFDVIDTTEASTLIVSNTKAVAHRGPVMEVAGGNTILTNNDWKVTGNFSGNYPWARTAVGVGFGGNVTINSGNYLADSEFMKSDEGYGVYIYTSGGTVNIEGGNFAGTTAALRADVDKGVYNTPANIFVNGGEFKGNLLASTKTGIECIKVNAGNFTGLTEKTLEDMNNIQIDGGVYNLDVTKKVSEGKEVISVTKKGDTKYYVGKEKVNEALNDIATGDKVTILQNVTVVKIPEGVKVENKSGMDITVNEETLKDGDVITVDNMPTATVVYSNDGQWTNQDVLVTLIVSEPVEEIKGWTQIEPLTYTKSYSDNAFDTVSITDMTGNTAKIKIDVKNIDKQAPEIRGIKEITLVQGTAFDPLKGIFAYDVECGEITDIEVTVLSTDVLDTNVPGVYTLQYSVTDLANNTTKVKRKVTVNPKPVVLNEAPVIKAKDVTMTVGGACDVRKGVKATDKEDGDLTKKISIRSFVQTNKAGTYDVIYSVMDSQGATATKTIKVTVKEKKQEAVKPDTNKKPAKKPGVNTSVSTSVGFFAGLAAISAFGFFLFRKEYKK